MNRFDRVTSLLLLLQTRSVITAKFLAEHFNVSERTIYRDIRTLETAGVPIGSEAGVGYFLERGYRLPPVCFTLDEAASLLLGEKLLSSSLDTNSLQDYKQALNKIKAVIDNSDKDQLSALDADIEVLPTGSHFPLDDIDIYSQSSSANISSDQSGIKQTKASEQENILDSSAYSDNNREVDGTDNWLRECRSALLHRQVIEIDYAAFSSQQHTTRQIEPIGLFYYSWHWHLIAWCRLRAEYRDFRLDRILSFSPKSEQFSRHSRLTLKEYIQQDNRQDELLEVELLFTPEAARFVQEQRYMFGFIGEEQLPDGVRMRFLTHVPEYMARWLLQFTVGVKVIHGESIKQALQSLSAQLSAHWNTE